MNERKLKVKERILLKENPRALSKKRTLRKIPKESLPFYRKKTLKKKQKRKETNIEESAETQEETQIDILTRQNTTILEDIISQRSTLEAISTDPKNNYLLVPYNSPQNIANIVWPLLWLMWMLPVTIAMYFNFIDPLMLQTNLTIWSFYIVMIFLISTIFYSISTPCPNGPRYHLHRYLHTLSFVNEMIVVLGYWPWAFQEDIPHYKNTCKERIICYVFTGTVHGVALLPPWITLIFLKTDVRIEDVVVWSSFALIYTFFIIGFSLKVKPIYPIVDFRHLTSFLMLLFMWVAAFIVFVIGYKISEWRTRKFYRSYSIG